MATKKAAPPPDPLDRLASASPKEIIALLLWKNRHANPELAEQIKIEDINGLEACVNYLECGPILVKIHRPEGRPATEAVPAVPGTPQRPGRSAIPARPADPPRPFVMVQLLDKDGNAFTPVESEEKDAQAADKAKLLRRAREGARELAGRLRQDMATGTYSNSTITEAADALVAMAGI